MPEAPAFSVARSSAWLHYALVEPDASARINRRILWLAPAGKDLPATVTLRESWQAGGVYFFLGSASLGDRALFAALRQWTSAAPEETRLVWVPAPSTPTTRWAAQTLRVRATQETAGTLLSSACVGSGGYAVEIERRGGVTLSAEDALFTFDDPLRLRTPAGDDALPITRVTLPLRGPSAGALTFGLEVRREAGAPDPLALLDAGLRFYHPTPFRTFSGGPASAAIRYPVLDLPETPIRFEGLIDPADPLGGRSGLRFVPDSPPLVSHFRTLRGGRLTLRPLEGAGFTLAPLGPRTAAPGALTLAPAGRFAVAPESPGPQLLCGTSGVEYLQLPEEGATLRFLPGQPAWAPLFVPPGEEAAVGAPTDAPRLDSTALTSWVTLSARAPLRYFAQPRDAVLHAPAAGGLLDYFAVQAGSLPTEGEDGEGAALPIVPYAGIDPEAHAVAAAFELEVLAPERRERVHAIQTSEAPRLLAAAAEGETVRAITPGGYLATFNADRTLWHTLRLAGLGDEEIVLEKVSGPLRAALLTSNQFLVISNPSSLAPHLDQQSRITVDGWTFDLHPRQWARHGTLLVLKSSDRSLRELVEDVGTWVLPETFNLSPALAQRKLETIIADARVRAAAEEQRLAEAEKPWSAFVRRVVDDPAWNGWLALRCPVPPDSLPRDLAQLAAGIDERRFFGHHLGMRQSSIPRPDEPPPDSALFGLIAYEHLLDPGSGGAVDFQVARVQVSLAASRVQSFSARIALTLGTLFGARARLRDTTEPPTLLLEGTLQRRGDSDVYLFRNESETDLELDDLILRSVLIHRCELGPAGGAPPPKQTDAEEVELTRFTLAGSLSFSPLPAAAGGTLDLFGYERLPFGGLRLEMRVPAKSRTGKRFRFDLSEVSFDSPGGRARRGSLPERFPLRPRGMISSDEAARPRALGFSPLIVPALDASDLGAEWLGLRFDLDLGTPGALADSVGLTAALALIWSPSPRRSAAMVGLRLPGASGGSPGVSLMGVIDLKVHQQQLLAVDGGYLLQLSGINVGFLGKSLPPEGSFSILIFGDPRETAGGGPLGWYGAYRGPAEPAPEPAEEENDEDLPVPRRITLRSSDEGRLEIEPAEGLRALLTRRGEGAPPPAWWGRPWARTLLQPTED